MTHPWQPGDPGDDELERLFAAEREAWRGDRHASDEPWWGDEHDQAWRGQEHFAEWPEASAGPEYWMYKRAAEE